MTNSTAAPADAEAAQQAVSAGMTTLLAVACGLSAANIYYAQPLIGLIAPAVGLGDKAASLIVTVTQIGYCLGLVLLVPLGDLVENRSLTFWTLSGAAAALAAAALAPSATAFLGAALLIGVASTAAQMLVPIAAHLAPDASRGRTIGNVMSGLLLGIMLARPFSSLIADALGWRAVFGVSALAIAVLAFALRALLPERRPTVDHGYVALIASLWTLLRDTPVLRRRAAYQAALFAAFSLFWTAVPLELAGPTFGLSQRGIALFAFAGAAGALSAPIVGRLADRGWGRASSVVSMAAVAAAFLVARTRRKRLDDGVVGGRRLAGRRRAGEPGRQPARHLCARRQGAEPVERPLHRDVLRRRRRRFVDCEPRLCAGRLGAGELDRPRLSRYRADAFCARILAPAPCGASRRVGIAAPSAASLRAPLSTAQIFLAPGSSGVLQMLHTLRYITYCTHFEQPGASNALRSRTHGNHREAKRRPED